MVSMCLLHKPELARTEQSSQGIFRQPPPETGSSVPKDAGGKMNKLQSNSDTYNNWLEPC